MDPPVLSSLVFVYIFFWKGGKVVQLTKGIDLCSFQKIAQLWWRQLWLKFFGCFEVGFLVSSTTFPIYAAGRYVVVSRRYVGIRWYPSRSWGIRQGSEYQWRYKHAIPRDKKIYWRHDLSDKGEASEDASSAEQYPSLRAIPDLKFADGRIRCPVGIDRLRINRPRINS